MDPGTLATTLATLVLTKAFEKTVEKTVEKAGERVIEQGTKLARLLKSKFPSTANVIERVTQHPELAKQEPEECSEEVLVEQLEEAANTDPEIAEAVQAVADAVMRCPQASIQDFTKLADEIAQNVQQGSLNIQN